MLWLAGFSESPTSAEENMVEGMAANKQTPTSLAICAHVGLNKARGARAFLLTSVSYVSKTACRGDDPKLQPPQGQQLHARHALR